MQNVIIQNVIISISYPHLKCREYRDHAICYVYLTTYTLLYSCSTVFRCLLEVAMGACTSLYTYVYGLSNVCCICQAKCGTPGVILRFRYLTDATALNQEYGTQ